jgi:hypothetical protein
MKEDLVFGPQPWIRSTVFARTAVAFLAAALVASLASAFPVLQVVTA